MNIEFEIKDIKHDINYAKKCEYDHVTLDVYKVQTLLTAYEKEKRLAETNLKDSEEFQDNMCNHRCILNSKVEELEEELEKEKEKNKEYKNLLIDMVNQFAYEDYNPKTRGSSEQKLYTGGLSVLEDVFYLLNIDEGIKREDLWKLEEE